MENHDQQRDFLRFPLKSSLNKALVGVCDFRRLPGPGRSDGRHGCVLNEAVKMVVDDAALIVIAIGHYLSPLL